MFLLDHLLRIMRSARNDRGADALTEAALRALGENNDSVAVAAAVEHQRQSKPDHFGLAYVAGLLAEFQASQRPWNQRTPCLKRAVVSYARAAELAEQGKVDGARLVGDVHDPRWSNRLPLAERALAAASFQAGRLLTADFRVRDPARAIIFLRQAVDRSPGYHPARYYLGEAYLLNGQFDAAEKAWRDALCLAPDEPALLAVLANLPADRVHHAVRAKDWPTVLRELARLPAGALPESERRTIEGDAYAALGQFDAARRAWQSALAADHLVVGVRRRLRRLDRSRIGGVL